MHKTLTCVCPVAATPSSVRAAYCWH